MAGSATYDAGRRWDWHRNITAHMHGWIRSEKQTKVERGKQPVSKNEFRKDPLYPRIKRAVAAILQNSKVLAPVDVLVGMSLLAPKSLDDWRRGRVPYLEKVIDCTLKPSVTVYMRWGKGPKQRLRFTKTGNSRLEEAYARHFVWPGKEPFHPPAPRGQGREKERESS